MVEREIAEVDVGELAGTEVTAELGERDEHGLAELVGTELGRRDELAVARDGDPLPARRAAPSASSSRRSRSFPGSPSLRAARARPRRAVISPGSMRPPGSSSSTRPGPGRN